MLVRAVRLQLSSLSVIFIVITTVVVARFATLLYGAFATPLIAIVTALLAAAIVPDGVSQHLQNLDRSIRVVAGDDQLTASGTFFGGFVSNDTLRQEPGATSPGRDC